MIEADLYIISDETEFRLPFHLWNNTYSVVSYIQYVSSWVLSMHRYFFQRLENTLS